MVHGRSSVYVNVNVPGSHQVQEDTAEKPQRRHSLFRAKVLMFLLLVGLLSYKFPIAALYITTKLFGAVSATTSAAGNVAIKAADTAIKAAEQAKNAAEAEMARRLIVKDALAALTPCSMLRCNSEMENIVELLSSLKEAHHKVLLKHVHQSYPLTRRGAICWPQQRHGSFSRDSEACPAQHVPLPSAAMVTQRRLASLKLICCHAETL